MFTRILLPLDGSRVAEIVLPQAVELARQHRAELWLLRVATAHAGLSGDPTESQVRAIHEAEVYLADVERRLAGETLPLHSTVRYGHAAEEIINHAAFNRIDLILMATHGRTGLAHAILGSVAERTVRHASCPVLLYRARPEPAAPADRQDPPSRLGRVDPAAGTVTIRKILCPVDFAEPSEEALDAAVGLAKRFGAELTVLHVVYGPIEGAVAGPSHPPLEPLKTELIRRAEALTEERLRERLGPRSGATAMVVVGPAAPEIIRHAQDSAVDLIVMATRSMAGPDYVASYGTIERVVRGAPCPVFTVQSAARDGSPRLAAAG